MIIMGPIKRFHLKTTMTLEQVRESGFLAKSVVLAGRLNSDKFHEHEPGTLRIASLSFVPSDDEGSYDFAAEVDIISGADIRNETYFQSITFEKLYGQCSFSDLGLDTWDVGRSVTD